MKLHLPVALRKSVLLLCVAASTITSAWGGAMHENIAQRVYADFGQNRGRYKVNGVSTMLQAIREKDNLIVIPDNNPDNENLGISLEQGMIDYSGIIDYGYSVQCYGAGAAFGNNYLVTVAHNPHFSAAFGGYVVGSDNTIKYSMVAASEQDLGSAADWALYRQNKIFTDVVGAQNYSGVTSEQQDADDNGFIDIKEQLEGTLMYRAGAGSMDYWMSDGSRIDAGDPYTYIIGGISTIRLVSITEEGFIFADWNMDNQDSGVSEKSPLPTTAGGGDSGTAVYVYNSTTGKYEYFFSERATNFTTYNVGHGSIDFANYTVNELHSRQVDMTETHTAYLNAVANGTGTVRVGDTEIEHLGVSSGKHTWKDLSAVKDKANWFAYDNGYMNSINALGSTHNLIFDGGSTDNTIILNATVDTGVGYLEFKNGKFTIQNAEGGNYTLNSAGYVINEGAEVHVQLTNDAYYMREWRKNGEGDLYIEGSGDNNILLAVGGSGTTYLNRENGYAAYNVMAASGATVVIKDINQIERDFTFGLNGGTLDMNGNGMDWYTTHANADAIAADGFSINTLTDSAILTNTKGTTKLTYKQSGESTWKGSIKDTATGAIQIVVDAGAGSVWTMNSICTDLSRNVGSSFTVKSGTAVLAGTNTEHGKGSVQYSNDIFFSEDDWHYADAQMDVTVNEGGTFQLGTHARLKGVVTVNGGTYVMNEGVRHRMEYIEGGLFMEDTYEWAEYYGHHGDTMLNNGTLKVQFDSKTTANTTYTGNITGNGTMSVDAGKGSLTLTGNNTFTGARSVENGTLIVEDAAAAGSEKWLVKDKGIFAAQNADGSTALKYIKSESTGVLALSQSQTAQIDMTGHNSLILGALEGMTINYGTSNTTETLNANANGEWRMGGGGGELVVNYHLTGNNKLILGNGHTQGTVTLTNTRNDFTGGVDFVSSGVTLHYTDEAAIKNISLNLTYGNRASMAPMIDNVELKSSGILLQNRADADIDMSRHASLFLGAEGNLDYTGNITVADGQDYRFSAANGTFTINSELEGGHNLIVDAQGFSGGTVKLTNASPITGSVTVTGASAGSGVNAGNITLRIDEDGLLDNASGVCLQKGGTLHIGESTQHIHNLELGEGSSIIGDRMSSADDTKYSTLHLTIDTLEDFKGTINVNTIHKYGDGTLELSGNSDNIKYREFFIEEGNVKLTKSNAYIGSVYINGESSFDLNGESIVQGSIAASNGALVKAGGAAIAGAAVIGAYEGTAVLDNEGSEVTVNGVICAFADATLVLSGTGNWKLSGSVLNSYDEKGTLRVEDVTNLTFLYGTNGNHTAQIDKSPCAQMVRIGGILDLAESVTDLKSAASCDLQVVSFSTIKLNGQDFKLSETTNQAEWRIKSLQSSGNETITWEASKLKESKYIYREEQDAPNVEIKEHNSSRLILTDEGSFNGTLVAWRTENGLAYNSYVELAHDKALQNATLQLEGYSGANMALAVNTDNAQIRGLNGNEHTLAYGGESYRVNQEAPPTSTRNSILSITGDGTYEYKGAVAGLSIAMDGDGTQKFTGSDVTVASIYANAGSLEFTAKTKVTDTIYMGMGGNLKMGESYSLNEGTTLAIVGDKGAFESTLVLNGGVLAFDSHALNAGTAQFNGNMVFAEGLDTQDIGILNPTDLDLSKTYTLFEGDWSGKKFDFHADTANYLKGSFTADANGLTMTLSLADGFAEWKGNNYSDFAAGTTILFRNTEVSKELSFSEPTTAAGLRFVNDETYTFSGSGVTLEGAVKMDSGKLVLNNKLTATTYESTGGTLEIAEDGTLHLTNKLTDTANKVATVDNIAGTGTLQVHLDTANGYDQKLAITKDFAGTTHVLEGNLTLSGSTFGSTLQLANGVNARSTEATTITGNLVLDGVSTIDNGGHTLTINGSVIGEKGTWNRGGGSTLNFNGEVNLGGFSNGSQYATTNFNGKTTIDTVTVYNDEAKMVFNGETSLGTVNLGQHNCVVTFSGETEIGTLNVGRDGNSTGNLTVNFTNTAAADAVNIIYKDAVLSGSGSLTTKLINYDAVASLNIDGLRVEETQANTKSWSGNTTTTINLKNGAVLDTRLSYNKHYSGILNIGGNDADGTMYMQGICLMPEDVESARSVLNISKGAHLIIAGDKAGTTAADFVLAVGGEKSQFSAGSNVINVEGVLTSNAAMTLYYKSADVNVKNGGRLNLLAGLNLGGSAYNDWVSGGVKASVLVEEGGELYAAGGKNRSELTVSLATNTTLGAIGKADSTVTFTNAMDWGTDGKEGTITIDTAATTADANLQLVRSEDQGVTVDFTGNINLKGSTALEVIGSGALKHKAKFNAASAIRVQEGATLAVDSTAELTAGAELNKGGLALHSATVSGKDITITDSASIRATGGTSTLESNTVLANAAAISYDVAEGATLKSTGSLGGPGRADIVKIGAGDLHLNNDGNAVANIRVDAGSLSVYGYENKLGHSIYNLNDLMVATGATLSFYAGVIDNQGAVGSVVVDGKASFTTGSQLNASLTLTTGSTLDMAEGHLSLTGSLTLQQGITLSDATLQRIHALGEGEQVTLFTGFEDVVFAASDYSQLSMVDDSALASTYFSNIGSDNYVLTATFNSANVGSLAIVAINIPEPATTTLSLLALSALVARRRRK